jgi:ribonuclease J
VDEARATVVRTLEHSTREEVADYGMIKEKIRVELKRFINRNTQRRPLIIPVIVEI